MKIEELLLEGSKELNINLDQPKIDQFLHYLNLLKRWNSRFNLTTIVEDNEIVQKHFIDSLTISEFIESNSSILDVGTGGGFPSVPLLISDPTLKITAIDSTEKKIFFVREVVRTLGLQNIDAINCRIEDENNGIERESFDYVVTRAFANVGKTLKFCLPYIKNSGNLILMRGKDGLKEWEEFISISTNCKILEKLNLIEKKQIVLPFSNIKRVVLVLGKR